VIISMATPPKLFTPQSAVTAYGTFA